MTSLATRKPKRRKEEIKRKETREKRNEKKKEYSHPTNRTPCLVLKLKGKNTIIPPCLPEPWSVKVYANREVPAKNGSHVVGQNERR